MRKENYLVSQVLFMSIFLIPTIIGSPETIWEKWISLTFHDEA